MAYELQKVEEASFFLDKLKKAICEDNLVEVKYYSSAFASAARSVFQFALEEICPELLTKSNKKEKKSPKKSFPNDCSNPNGKTWYDHEATDPLIKLFKEFRDQNIHKTPAPLSKGCTVYGDCLHHKTSPGEQSYTEPKVKSVSFYHLKEWDGEEDLETLCAIYLEKLKSFVEAGKEKGHLAP